MPDKITTCPNPDPNRSYVLDYIEFIGQGNIAYSGMACQLQFYRNKARIFRKVDDDECGSDENRDSKSG